VERSASRKSKPNSRSLKTSDAASPRVSQLKCAAFPQCDALPSFEDFFPEDIN
jgi:hypothetical protein